MRTKSALLCFRSCAHCSWQGQHQGAVYSLPWVVEHLELPAFDHHDPLADAQEGC